MQRRAVAVAAALFLVVGGLSLGLVLTAETPQMNLENDNTFQEGDRFNFAGQTYTVDTVNASEPSGGGHGGGGSTAYELVIQWQTDQGVQNESLGQHDTVTLSGETFFAHFESGEEVVLSADMQQFRQYQFDTTQYETHTNGLWGVTILSGIVAVLLIGMGYMPSRY